MTLTLKIMYWENNTTITKEVTMGDTTKMDDDNLIPKTNVIFMIFSTKVQGQDTRVYEKSGFDNYQITTDSPGNISAMYAYDDVNGGWFRHAAPLANDGYIKSFQYPGLQTWSKANMVTWKFLGVQLTGPEWDSTLAARNALR